MTSEAVEAFLESYDDQGDAHIPQRQSDILCCCIGNCAHAQRNTRIVQDLERDVRSAAQLGKALLLRHEAYVTDAERERQAMMAQIEALEQDKRALEQKNATTVLENRTLLDQLEGLNTAVAESDNQVTTLQTTLQSTQDELHRLMSLASRTERLEQQIVDFESEQISWQSTLEEKEQTAKSALRKWQDSQRALNTLQEEMERLDLEAKQDRERHVELLGRMERRHAVERELDSAAGRLKGAAALKNAGSDAPGTNVVSHFVKDILQDNANLQMGIVELRDMLQNSNEEVETLRKQILAHDPPTTLDDVEQASPVRPHLRDEMRRATAQELHVHHHYHAPPTATKSGAVRRPKRRRYGALNAGHASGSSTPRSSISQIAPSSAATILQQTAASLPEISPIRQRLSLQSNQPFNSTHVSSGPSSPESTNRTSSLYDRVFSDNGYDSSRPVTPETEDMGSPRILPMHSKRPSYGSVTSHAMPSAHRTRPSLDSILDMSLENLRQFEQQSAATAIPEEDEPDWGNASSPMLEEASSATSPFSDAMQEYIPRTIRRAASHESLLSVSGMDIHTLRSRPSQLLTPHGGRSVTTQAVITDATAVAARPAASRGPSATGRSILSGMAADQRQPPGRPGLGKKVGGWMFGRWGSTPAPSTVASAESAPTAPPARLARATSMTSSSDGRSIEDSSATPRSPKHRPPGINQIGPIPGLGPETRRLHPPIMNSLDQEALKNLLEMGSDR